MWLINLTCYLFHFSSTQRLRLTSEVCQPGEEFPPSPRRMWAVIISRCVTLTQHLTLFSSWWAFFICSQAAAPLMRYLEQELQYMNENLVQKNFNGYDANWASHVQQLFFNFLFFLPWFVLIWHYVTFSSLFSLLKPLWENSVKILHQLTAQYSQQEGLMVFSQRLLYTLQVGAQSGGFMATGSRE